ICLQQYCKRVLHRWLACEWTEYHQGCSYNNGRQAERSRCVYEVLVSGFIHQASERIAGLQPEAQQRTFPCTQIISDRHKPGCVHQVPVPGSGSKCSEASNVGLDASCSSCWY